MFDQFQPFTITTQADPPVDIFGLKSGDAASSALPPLLLLHGFPQTHHIWHRIAPQLTSRYTVILMDLRGYGQSSKPAPLACYAKSAMARDCVAVMDRLGYTAGFFVCAHDRGARVAHKLCVDYPDRVAKAIFLDICPTLAMYRATDFAFARAYWHWFFLIQPAPLPETLILGSPRRLAEAFMPQNDASPPVFADACFAAYVRSLADPDAVHAMCQDYRAGATLDLDEARADLDAGRRLRNPLLVIWGRHGVIEKCFDAVKEWKAVADDGVDIRGHSADSGHYLPEQVPDHVASAVLGFLQ